MENVFIQFISKIFYPNKYTNSKHIYSTYFVNIVLS